MSKPRGNWTFGTGVGEYRFAIRYNHMISNAGRMHFLLRPKTHLKGLINEKQTHSRRTGGTCFDRMR